MEAPFDHQSKPLGHAAKVKQSSNDILLKTAVAVALFIALVSLAFAGTVHISVYALQAKIENCAMITEVDRTTREQSGLVDNQELKALYGEIAEIRSKVTALILNTSVTHSELKSIVDGIQEEVIVVRKSQGEFIVKCTFLVCAGNAIVKLCKVMGVGR